MRTGEGHPETGPKRAYDPNSPCDGGPSITHLPPPSRTTNIRIPTVLRCHYLSPRTLTSLERRDSTPIERWKKYA